MNVGNMAFELPEKYASEHYVDDPRVLSGLELAKYVMLRLTNDRDTVKKIAADVDEDETFVIGVVKFLFEVGWIKEDKNGNYLITKKGKNGIITRTKRIVTNWGVTKPEA